MRIARLEPPRGRWSHQRVVFADGTRLRVNPAALAALGLAAGDEIDAETVQALRLQDTIAGARLYAQRLLAVRPRSRHELLTRLRLRRVPPAVCETILEELEHDGLLDDARFARLWLESRLAHRPSGAVRLRAELRQKGVDRAVIDGVIAARLQPADETALALRVARGLARRYRSADRKTAFRRLAGALERRGFSTAAIVQTLSHVLGTAPDAESS